MRAPGTCRGEFYTVVCHTAGMRSLSALLLLALSPAVLAINLNAPLNPDPVRTPVTITDCP